MSSFKWGNGEIFIKPPTGRTRNYYFHLKTLAGVYDMPNGFERELCETGLFLLSRVDRVEGDVGLHVPNGDATPATLLTFCDTLMNTDEELFLLWNGTVIASKSGGNDPDLLPPEELHEDKKKTSNSKTQDDSSD